MITTQDIKDIITNSIEDMTVPELVAHTLSDPILQRKLPNRHFRNLLAIFDYIEWDDDTNTILITITENNQKYHFKLQKKPFDLQEFIDYNHHIFKDAEERNQNREDNLNDETLIQNITDLINDINNLKEQLNQIQDKTEVLKLLKE